MPFCAAPQAATCLSLALNDRNLTHHLPSVLISDEHEGAFALFLESKGNANICGVSGTGPQRQETRAYGLILETILTVSAVRIVRQRSWLDV